MAQDGKGGYQQGIMPRSGGRLMPAAYVLIHLNPAVDFADSLNAIGAVRNGEGGDKTDARSAAQAQG